MTPLVSILIPSFNNRPFLEERVETIFNQTFSSWELVVVDNYSDDGAWEFFKSLAQTDDRVRVSQAPRNGLYTNWNNCIRQAVGRYVYIAGNDDIMAADFLEKQVAALEQFPECGLAHSSLQMINETGQTVSDWWRCNSAFARSSDDLIDRRHLRLAPFDGLLHLGGEPVYVSLTQLLIRRSLFDHIGLFEDRWGAVGDFNWNMRASLVTSTVHVPDTWGGWRVHRKQATDWSSLRSAEHFQKVDDMIESALDRCKNLLPPSVGADLRSGPLADLQQFRIFFRQLSSGGNSFDRKVFIARSLSLGSAAARHYLRSRLQGTWRSPEIIANMVNDLFERTGTGPALLPA